MNVCDYMASGQLLFIGLGLYDEKDVSLNGLSEIKNCDKIFSEFYTSKLIGINKDSFKQTFGKDVEILSRKETENGDKILNSALNEKVVFLVCGDPMIATTHIDLRLRAIKKGINNENTLLKIPTEKAFISETLLNLSVSRC